MSERHFIASKSNHKITDLSILLETQKKFQAFKRYQAKRIKFAIKLVKIGISKFLTGSLTILSLASIMLNFLFPSVAIAATGGKNKILSFNLSKSAKAAPLFLAKNEALTIGAISGNRAGDKAPADISEAAPVKMNNTIRAVAAVDIEKEKPVAKTAMANDSVVDDKMAYIPVAGEFRVKKTKRVLITAFSSTPDQTDSTPFITASGKHVRDGIVAANWLPFGAKVRIPVYSGDKIYIVEDRMKSNVKMDIWFLTRQAALNFGAKYLEVEILEAL